MNMLINPNGANELVFTNKKLQNATMQIMQIAGKIRNNWFEVGAIIAMVDAQELYKDDGFNNVHEWTTRAFKIKKTMSYDLLKIGREYTREILSKSGKIVGYECNLNVPDTTDRFELTQVIRMLPAGHEKAQEMVEAKVITPDMSSNAIAKVVKAAINPEPEQPEPEQPEPEQPEQSEPETVSHDEWLRMTFDKISTKELIEELALRGYYVIKHQEGGENNE